MIEVLAAWKSGIMIDRAILHAFGEFAQTCALESTIYDLPAKAQSRSPNSSAIFSMEDGPACAKKTRRAGRRGGVLEDLPSRAITRRPDSRLAPLSKLKSTYTCLPSSSIVTGRAHLLCARRDDDRQAFSPIQSANIRCAMSGAQNPPPLSRQKATIDLAIIRRSNCGCLPISLIFRIEAAFAKARYSCDTPRKFRVPVKDAAGVRRRARQSFGIIYAFRLGLAISLHPREEASAISSAIRAFPGIAPIDETNLRAREVCDEILAQMHYHADGSNLPSAPSTSAAINAPLRVCCRHHPRRCADG